jgi:hypothetical protein
MPTQIELLDCMTLLLAARDPRVMRGGRSRRGQLYVRWQVSGSLMRHLRGFATIQVALLPCCVVRSAGRGSLVAPTGRAQRVAPPKPGALRSAVHIPVVAIPAQEEHLTTATAHHEAQRIHGSGRDRQQLDADPQPCDEALVDPGSGRTT